MANFLNQLTQNKTPKAKNVTQKIQIIITIWIYLISIVKYKLKMKDYNSSLRNGWHKAIKCMKII